MKTTLFIGALLCLGWAQVRSEETTYSGDVCNNFYGYTCDRQTPEFKVGPYDTLVRQYQPESVKNEIENILKQDVTVRGSENITTAQYLYQTCLRKGSEVEDHLADSEFVKAIRSDGGCPMLVDSWTGSENVQLLNTQKYYPSLFSLRVEDHELYIDNYDMSVYGRFLSNVYGPKKLFNEAKYKELVKELIKKLAGKLGFQPKDEVLNKDVDDLMIFRQKLHELTIKSYETGYLTNVTHVNIDEVKSMVNYNRNDNIKIDWEQFYHYLVVHDQHKDVLYMDKRYIRGLMELLMATPSRTIMNHIKFHYIETHFAHISEEYRNLYKQMFQAAYEHYVPKTDAEWCIKHTHINVPFTYNYLQKWFPRSYVDKSKKMVEQVKKHYVAYIFKHSKLAPAEITEIVKLINDIEVVIGAEEEYMDYNFLNQYVDVSKYSLYFDKLIHLYENLRQVEIDSLYNQKKSVSHYFDVTYTSPLMYPQHSRIVIPLGYLHFHRMSPMLPAIYSYPTLGRAISDLISQMMCMKGHKDCYTQEIVPQRHMTPVYGPLETARCYVKQWCPEQGVSNQIYDTKYNYDCGSYYYWSKLGLQVAYDAYYDLLQTNQEESRFLQENQLDARTFFHMYAKENCEFMKQFPIQNVAQQKYEEMMTTNTREINTCVNSIEAFRTVFHCQH